MITTLSSYSGEKKLLGTS